MSRFDRYGIGILIGLALPALFGAAYMHQFHLWGAFKALNWSGELMTNMMVLACFPDLACLFLFYTTDTWRLSKGVLLGMFPYLLAAIWFMA